MSAGTPKQEEILAQYPDIIDYKERIELLSSVKITGESLNFAERKEVKAQLDLIQMNRDTIKKLTTLKASMSIYAEQNK